MSQPQTETTTATSTESTTYTGRVKWFNSKAGYGFITVCDGEHAGKDIFVHFSSINSANPQYKYLVQGEYVDFSVTKPENSDHEYHAVNVGGVKGGNLMCETRRETYTAAAARKAAAVADNIKVPTTATTKTSTRPQTATGRSTKTATTKATTTTPAKRQSARTTQPQVQQFEVRTVKVQVPLVSATTGEVIGYRRERIAMNCPIATEL